LGVTKGKPEGGKENVADRWQYGLKVPGGENEKRQGKLESEKGRFRGLRWGFRNAPCGKKMVESNQDLEKINGPRLGVGVRLRISLLPPHVVSCHGESVDNSRWPETSVTTVKSDENPEKGGWDK